MTKLLLAAGVAALAFAAPAAAERGGHEGHGKNKNHAAKADRGAKGHASKSDRRAKAERSGKQRFAMVDRGKGREGKAERRVQQSHKRDRAEHERYASNDRRDDRRENHRADRRDDRRGQLRFGDRDDRRDRDFRDRDRFDRRFAGNWSEGCPPGLAKKHNGCLPPGHAKRLDYVGQRLPAAYGRGIVPRQLRNLYRDNDDYYYRYGDGYMYRVDRRTQLVASLLPLVGGGYVAGQMFPTSYRNSYVPNYYQSFYPDTADSYYRYANGNVYEVDPYSGMIEDVIPMYGNGYGYGQMLPASYSTYNVPYQYRDMYADTSDYHYRYAPGAIYQVDARSNLITAVASLLAGDLGVGSRLPEGYGAYNVPLNYRSTYFDTSDAWYRYNDGYIYRVDPKTQLITSVINALV